MLNPKINFKYFQVNFQKVAMNICTKAKEYLTRTLLTFSMSCVLLFCSQGNVWAQTGEDLNLSNLSSINVDDLSDAQILNFMRVAEERGLSETEVEALALARGVSRVQINKLKSRINTLRYSSGNTQAFDPSVSREAPITSNTDVFGLLANEQLEGLTDYEKRIFGYGLFRKSSISFAPNINIPTPEGYVLGTGDELIVDLWGTTQQSISLVINNEGFVRPKNLAPLYLNGLTIEEASKRVLNRLSQVYSGLKGDSPTIFHQVSLGNIKTISVEVIGSVNQPGLYSLSSLSTVYTALHASGGPSVKGTFRNIRLIRNNKLFTNVDIYSFLTQGIKTGDERLKNGDIIVVPPYKTRVELVGSFTVPGFYEPKEGEKLEDIISYANGFNGNASKELLSVIRKGDLEKEIIDINKRDVSTFELQNDDLVKAFALVDRFSNRVEIRGAVYRRGEYQLTNGMMLTDLIKKAKGLRGDAFGGRVSIYRLEEDYTQKIISVDMDAVNSNQTPDIALMNNDVVNIPSIYDLKEERFVQVSGEVAQPGFYPFFEEMSVQDLITLAGGLNDASSSMVEIARRKVDDPQENVEILNLKINKDLRAVPGDQYRVSPFDQVVVRRNSNYNTLEQVTLEGEVAIPGVYTIKNKTERISDLIVRSGGLTNIAYAKGAALIRKNDFSRSQERYRLNQSNLRELRKKLLSNQSQIKTSSELNLIERINKLQEINERRIFDDVNGSRLRQDLLQDLSQQDSLIDRINFESTEPVAINLVEILENPGGEGDLYLQPGDLISIPKKMQTVRVVGEVTSILSLKYNSRLSFKDYILQTGGFLNTARKSGSYVQYANGERRGVRRFLFFKFYPKVEPGATIIVAKKPERTPITFQGLFSVASSAATLILLIDRIGR
ncbi:MAG: SLBB domain-containing protein [Roseivirga sp.]